MRRDAAGKAPPRVSVVIPVYNRESYLAAAIDSILKQDFDDFEIVLIDDGSDDPGTLRLLAEYGSHSRVRLLTNPANLGIAATHNRALEEARGDYVAMLDSDDLARKDRLRRQAAFLDRHREHAAVGSRTQSIDTANRRRGRPKRLPLATEDVRARYLFKAAMPHASIMARRRILVGEYYDDRRFKVCADFDLFARISARHPVANLPQVLVMRRQHGGRATLTEHQRLRPEKKIIAAERLRALGLDFTDLDLDRHYELMRPQAAGNPPSTAYLDWADVWLSRMLAANRSSGRYDQAALGRLCGEIWARICWRAGRPGWRRFWRSDLCRRALARTRSMSRLP